MRPRWAPRCLLFAVIASATACASDSSNGDGALGGEPRAASSIAASADDPGAAATSVPVTDAVVATDLAPSQRVGSTVPDPVTPVPCSVDDLEFWTARVVPGESTSDVVIRVRNAGPVRCDADISGSIRLDPAVEPDVWLDRDATADLVVGQAASDCTSPSVVASIDVAIGDADTVVDVPSLLVTCDWWLTAFYPNQPVRDACEREALELAVTPRALLVRNGSARPCALGGIIDVDGAQVVTETDPGISVHELSSGDVVAFGRPTSESCDGSSRRVELFDELVQELVFDDVPCDLAVDLGGGRPWFGSDDAQWLGANGDPLAASAVLDALDRFETDE